jgi:osmoprotectant transport system permease protein
VPDDEPLVRWGWIGDHLGYLGQLTLDHAVMSLVPVLIGLLLAVPLGLVCARFPRLYQPLALVFNTLYALPALAVFMLLLPYTGPGNLSTVMIPLTFYAVTLLLPTTVEGIRSTPDAVRQAAVALGYGPWRRLATVELPSSVPYLVAGLRVAAVSSISMAALGALVGRGALGYLFINGFQLTYTTPILAGIVLIVALALLVDLTLVLARRVLAPWAVREQGAAQ